MKTRNIITLISLFATLLVFGQSSNEANRLLDKTYAAF